MLGGVEIPHDRSLDGHSDADVLLHAVTDAILGAAAMGDIGELFPNTAKENKDRDSAELLTVAHEKILDAGFTIINLDCIVFAEQPKLSAFKTLIAGQIAGLLAIEPNRVGIKAKTGERVGPVGRQEAMRAQVVALLIQA